MSGPNNINNENIHQFVNEYLDGNPNRYEHIWLWDVSDVTDMSNLFRDKPNFNQPLSTWDVSNVTNMSGMFQGATKFNQPLNKWIVSNVTNMSGMFLGATNFNQPLDKWDVKNVTNMVGMFSFARRFNQPLFKWNVENVTDMSHMFSGASSFNQNLNTMIVNDDVIMDKMFDKSGLRSKIDKWPIRKNETIVLDSYYSQSRGLCGLCFHPLNGLALWVSYTKYTNGDVVFRKDYNDAIRACPNGHLFHRKCIIDFVEHRYDPHCPTCNGDLIQSDGYSIIETLENAPNVTIILSRYTHKGGKRRNTRKNKKCKKRRHSKRIYHRTYKTMTR